MGDPNEKARAVAEKFRAIALERLERLNNNLVELETHPDSEELVRETLREVHTLKGEARWAKFADINFVAHQTESLLFYARDQKFRVDREVFDLVLGGLDLIASLLQKGLSQDESSPDLTGFAARVQDCLGRHREPAAATDPSKEQPAAAAAPSKEQPAQALPRPSAPVTSSRAEDAIRIDLGRLDKITALASTLTQVHGALENTINALASSADVWVANLRWIQVESGLGANFEDVSGERLRIAWERLSSWLVDATQQAADARKHAGGARERVFANRLLSQELESQIRDLRLLPLVGLFRRYLRPMRDLAAEQGKKIHIEISESDVAVDMQVINRISEPLLHILRNAIDHGMETPSERAAQGKSETGTISLGARQHGGTVHVTIRDDGRGVDLAAVKQAAVRKRLLNEDEIQRLSERETLSLLFRSGFTTRTSVTDVSGRGVGLDVVRESIGSLGGSVDVTSEAGKGTTFSMVVPVSAVLARLVVARCGAVKLAFPTDAVVNLLRVTEETIERIGSGAAVRVEGDLVPLSDLPSLLGQSGDGGHDEDGAAILVVEHAGVRLALAVDEHLGHRQALQRPLDLSVAALPLFTGTVTLAAGELALVVNVPQLFAACLRAKATRIPAGIKPQTKESLVLVVDDSELTRDGITSLIRSMGHRVIATVNGAAALEAFKRQPPDLVVTDLEMPILDGFGLIAEIRAREAHSDVPIIVLSTHGEAEDKQKAASLGADAYVVKHADMEPELARVVHRFLQRDVPVPVE